jgi:hypothetical protein
MDNLESRVLKALENAEENGYRSLLMMLSPNQIAIDMCDLIKEFEGTNPETIIPIISAWKEKNEKWAL